MAAGSAEPLFAAVREDKAAAAARRGAVRLTGRGGGGTVRSGRSPHRDADHGEEWNREASAQARAERHRAAAAEMKRWRSEGALDDPVPLV